jgi:hypothetical protein
MCNQRRLHPKKVAWNRVFILYRIDRIAGHS